MKKILSITAAAILIIIIVLFVLIKFYVTPERIKEFVVSTAEKSVNRKINIGEINISLLTGIGIKEFAIKEADEKADFIRCNEFILKFKLLPLISKRVIVDELRLVSPDIRISRNKKGKYNFEDIGKKEVPDKAVEEKEGETDKGLPISLLLNKISISDAKFSFKDLMKELPDLRSSADIDISIKSVDGSELFTEGNIDIKIDEAVLRKPQKKHIRNISSKLSYAVNVNLESNDLFIDKVDIKIQKTAASIKGSVRKFKTSPEVDLAVNLPKTKTAEIMELAALFADLKDIKLSGHFAADLKVKGLLKKPESMKAKGNISLDKLGISYNKINALLDGRIKLNEKTMNVDMTGSSGKNSARIKGSVSSLFKNQNIKLNVYSKKLFIDELEPVLQITEKHSSEKTKTPVSSTAKEVEADPVNLKLTASGEVKVDTAFYKGMVMNNFRMKYSFKNNKLKLTEAGKTGKGKFNIKTLMDLAKRGYTYSMSGNVDSLHIEEIVNAFFPKAKDTVFGIFTSDFKLNGAGTLSKNMKKNLIVDGGFNIRDGKISNAELARKLSLFVNVRELETIEFTKAEGAVKIRNGVARLDSIFTSDNIAMDPKGNIGLDETIDLAFDLKLSPRLTDKAMSSKISQYIRDRGGWGTVPLLVTGTLSNPKYTVDVAKVGKKVIEKEVNKFLEKLLNKDRDEKRQPPPEKETQTQEPEPVNPLEDLIKQLPGQLFK
ncbi:MAG: AsmA family protein [Nitrospirota bacterium]